MTSATSRDPDPRHGNVGETSVTGRNTDPLVPPTPPSGPFDWRAVDSSVDEHLSSKFNCSDTRFWHRWEAYCFVR